MPKFLRQPTAQARDSHQAISRRDILKWGIASSVLLAALARTAQLLLGEFASLLEDLAEDHPTLVFLVIEYNSLVWIFPIAFAAFAIHALRKPVVFQHYQIRAVRYMKIVVAVSVPCLVLIWTFIVWIQQFVIVN